MVGRRSATRESVLLRRSKERTVEIGRRAGAVNRGLRIADAREASEAGPRPVDGRPPE
ncbi:hypothetical protein AwMethylo_06890 [Methylobacterium sp.]|nr:hypothetical protein AwMethylo_06890 [Methylobacterium sp.]